MIRKLLAIGSIALCCVIGYSFKVDAAEEINLLSAEERREVCESLTELDVPIETQVALIKKLEAGQVWDCMKEENIEKFNAMEYRFSPENSTKRLVCEDGSVLQQSIEFEGSIRAFSAMKTTYNNVKISINNGLSGGGFYASYVIDWNAHNDGFPYHCAWGAREYLAPHFCNCS